MNDDERKLWMKVLKEESNRFRPLHDVFLRIREQERKQVYIYIAVYIYTIFCSHN